MGRSATGGWGWGGSYPYTQLPATFLPNFRSFVSCFILNKKYQHGSKSYSLGNDRPPLLPAERPPTLYTTEPVRQHHAVKTHGKSGGKAPHVVDLAPAKFRCLSASFSWYLLDGKLRRPRRKYGRDGYE